MVPPEPAIGRARLAIVGEVPGHTELAKGRPFVGAGGRLLMRGVHHELHLQRGDVHWTYAVPCQVSDRELAAARKCCAPRLTAELDACGAPVVMPVGAHGTRSVLGLRSAPIMKYRGSVSPKPLPNGAARFVCPTIHPIFALRQPLWMPILERDVCRVGRVMRDGWTAPERLNDRRIVYARRESHLEAALPQLGPIVGADVETVGLGPTETLLVCLALSDGQLTVVVPWARTAAGVRPWWRDGGRNVAALLTETLRDRIAVTHNGPIFDHIVMARYGIHVNRWEDTLQASHAFESHLPRGLDRVATTWLDVGPWKQWEHSKRLTDLWTYNARDTLYTVLAWHAMKGNVT